MWTLAVAIFLVCKCATWLAARNSVPHTGWRSWAYFAAWPGMDATKFLDTSRSPARPRVEEWLWALCKTGLGVLLFWGVARRVPERLPLLQGWVGLVGMVLTLHFGSFHLVALFWQRLGIAAQPIMDRPVLSRTLSEFWGKRWNLGFRQLAYDLVFHPLHRQIGARAAGLLVFVISGLIHDLVISLPSRGGYGLPTGYFILQGLGVALERSALGRRIGLQSGIRGWVFMFLALVGPVFWLFHPPFVMRVILPFMRATRAL
jgi:alginate O-acetyltransferase complex protein AlgI